MLSSFLIRKIIDARDSLWGLGEVNIILGSWETSKLPENRECRDSNPGLPGKKLPPIGARDEKGVTIEVPSASRPETFTENL